ncbi:hypothetical protein Verru16b_02631 [Lacunisphaera limnophila]|uniref:General secretion pathway protein B n=1 Tax=Lacunisphaera limnophila TaxID=1838286 RepID=A0A1D8AXE9_9BACT|nr:hypothetical protein [Lacunisphaera limnophila]AOS45550.1 hypothetical protein Verru16b_02631 [Lacunisphaera limnophila]
MSLINDALKKAQKQRTGEAPPLAAMPTIGGESPRHISRRGKPASSTPLYLGLGGAGVLVVLVAGFFLLRPSSGPVAPAPAEKPAVIVPANMPPPAIAATTQPAPAPTTPNVFVVPLAPPPAVAEPPAARVAETRPAAQPAAPTVAEPARAATPPRRLDARATTYIESIRVAGIRASATDSKVLMNDRVYRAGDLVEHEMGLKLIGITSSSLTFEDPTGAQYTRNF